MTRQTLLCLLRPVIVNCYNDWYNKQVSILRPFLGQSNETHDVERLTLLYYDALESARQIADMFRWQLETGNLGDLYHAITHASTNTVQYFFPILMPASYLVLRQHSLSPEPCTSKHTSMAWSTAALFSRSRLRTSFRMTLFNECCCIK